MKNTKAGQGDRELCGDRLYFVKAAEKASLRRCHLHRNVNEVSKSIDLRGSALWADGTVNTEHVGAGLISAW